MNRVLYLTLNELEENSGITAKIIAQKNAFDKRVGCYFGCLKNIDGNYCYEIDGEIISKFGKGIKGKIKSRINFNYIYEWVKHHSNDVSLIFIRYTQFANPASVDLLNKIKKLGIKIIMEIPTYPYDKELIPKNVYQKVSYHIERIYRKKLFSLIDKIATFSDDSKIEGVPTIKINNSVNISQIPLKCKLNVIKNEINLIGVASIEFWHGYDRLINGLIDYYKKPNNDLIIKFHIVGGKEGNSNLSLLKEKVKNNNLDDFVIFHGPKSGKDLDNLFDICDIAVGSLGRHRTGHDAMQSLKNVEYAIRGIPFIYSENNKIFDDKSYVLKPPADESNIDINSLINFYENASFDPSCIRNSVLDLTWDNQINKILNSIN